MRLALLAWAHAVLLRRAPRAQAPINFNYYHHGQDWVMASCSARDRPSPLDILAGDGVGLPPATLPARYMPETRFKLTASGHAVHVDLENLGLGGLTLDNAWYNLMYVNVHAPSEHTFDGQRYPLELQLVHKRWDTNALAIVAVPFAAPSPAAIAAFRNATNRTIVPVQTKPGMYAKPDPNNLGYDPVLEVFTDRQPPQPGASVDVVMPRAWDLNALVSGNVTGVMSATPLAIPGITSPPIPPPPPPAGSPAAAAAAAAPPPLPWAPPAPWALPSQLASVNLTLTDALAGQIFEIPPSTADYVRYEGSLTMPPCSSNVIWFVRKQPRTASAQQVELLAGQSKALVPEGNYRAIMPRPSSLEVGLVTAVEAEPPLEPPALLQQPKVDVPADEYETRAESAALNWGRQAALQALKHAGTLKDIDQRLRKAMMAHSAEIAPQMPAPPSAGAGPAVPDGFAKQYVESLRTSIHNSVEARVMDLANRVNPYNEAQAQANAIGSAIPPGPP